MSKTKIPINPILSARIRETRLCIKDGKKMTQLELADALGVDEQTIRKYENGKQGIPKVSVEAIAKAFGCCPEYLYGQTNSFTQEEYAFECEQTHMASIISYTDQMESKRRWDTTVDLFQSFLNHSIRHSYITDENGSIIPVVIISDLNNRQYVFNSRHEVETFLSNYYEAATKLLRYHLLDFTEQNKTATKPTPAP